MTNHQAASYTTEEIADLLKVSKLTVYDLIKKGELRAYRVGRQMRVDAEDLEAYKDKSKSGGMIVKSEKMISETPEQPITRTDTPPPPYHYQPASSEKLIISGQDISLDLLANAIAKSGAVNRPLRSYTGSLNSLIAMYEGEADIVSTHLFDGDTGTYNIPYIKRILSGREYIVVNLLSRPAGLFVQKNNPKNIRTWADLNNSSVKMVNREIGSGARVLLDEKLRLEGINPRTIDGYHFEEMNHIAVASKVASGAADVGVGIEKAAALVGVDFIPLIHERYDLVMYKTPENKFLRDSILSILRSKAFQNEIGAIGGYDLSLTGTIMYETE
ncbi:helix-turn-helix transcriptional regulator [Sporosarcina sp. ACRSL]|uniref:helix-turn-helix transcriptional regulator n=1 Tax=Sporosarcina sp. ACRSL TaxID=2918215 RepID=UPI001EF527C7|nr:helix-turn-helix transcriptional regulator [Sporosarcina sp. ACRSL]MCG7345222.1 helix-turn-helix transcriptional regulator [Sporosarcina sp. ACRSL]